MTISAKDLKIARSQFPYLTLFLENLTALLLARCRCCTFQYNFFLFRMRNHIHEPMKGIEEEVRKKEVGKCVDQVDTTYKIYIQYFFLNYKRQRKEAATTKGNRMDIKDSQKHRNTRHR